MSQLTCPVVRKYVFAPTVVAVRALRLSSIQELILYCRKNLAQRADRTDERVGDSSLSHHRPNLRAEYMYCTKLYHR
jgi:hypothetical protein